MMPHSSSPFKDTLRLEVDHRGKAIVVKLTGSAHMENMADLQDRLVDLVNEQPEQLVIDLSCLNFISSMGLGGIIAAHLKCRHHGGVVKLVSPKPAIMDLLEVTKLTKLFPIHDTVEEAIAAG